MTLRPIPTTLSLPAEWEGCEHVVPCRACDARGWLRGIMGRETCPVCQGGKVRWNRRTISENMALRGYRVEGGECWFVPRDSPLAKGFTVPESQVRANLWDSAGPTIPPAPPIDRSLLNGPGLTEEQINAVALVGGLEVS